MVKNLEEGIAKKQFTEELITSREECVWTQSQNMFVDVTNVTAKPTLQNGQDM